MRALEPLNEVRPKSAKRPTSACSDASGSCGILAAISGRARVFGPSTPKKPYPRLAKDRIQNSGALGSFCPRHRANDIGDDQPAICGVPRQNGVCLCQSNKGGHRCRAGGNDMSFVVLGHDLDLELAILSVRASYPIGVENLHSPRLLTRAGHTNQ
jgi:hypothetical protein